jgi:hypothetical protein
VAQSPSTVSGSPPGTTTTITGLANGTEYTFTVRATNSIGSGLESAASAPATPVAAVVPAFVQAATAHALNVGSLTVRPTTPVATGDRLLVEVLTWSNGSATSKSVADSAGNIYTLLTSVKASDKTQMAVYTTRVSAGGGTTPTVTATASATADIGVTLVEYSGLLGDPGTAVLDVLKTATGTSAVGATVTSGATPAATNSNEIAVAFFGDSGFGDTLATGAGWTSRSSLAPTNDAEMLVEDQSVGAGSTPSGSVKILTGKRTTWLMVTLVLKHA